MAKAPSKYQISLNKAFAIPSNFAKFASNEMAKYIIRIFIL